jgi:hypothetical protein
MKLKLPSWYEMIYIAVAVATFKHSAWAYSVTLEGAAPEIDWATWGPSLPGLWAAGGLLAWYFWGALMAVAADVSMFYSAREIRRGNRFHILTFAAAATFSAATQLIYATTHAVDLSYVASSLPAVQPGTGWLWTLSEYRIVYLPISLPLTAIIYTCAILFSGEREIKAGVLAPPPPPPAPPSPVYSARDAAKITGRNYNYVLTLCNKGVVGKKLEDGSWELSVADLRRLDKGGVHEDTTEDPGP